LGRRLGAPQVFSSEVPGVPDFAQKVTASLPAMSVSPGHREMAVSLAGTVEVPVPGPGELAGSFGGRTTAWLTSLVNSYGGPAAGSCAPAMVVANADGPAACEENGQGPRRWNRRGVKTTGMLRFDQSFARGVAVPSPRTPTCRSLPGMRICVFCGSSPGRSEAYAAAAREFGALLAKRGIGVVYGGASVGTMGMLADAALAAGAEVIGVLPRSLVDREVAHRGLTDLRIVDDMHERKATMAALADAFVALPGGAGTLEELFEVWTWSQLGLHHKPIGLLDVQGYYRRLVGFFDHMVEEGFLSTASRDAILCISDGRALLDELTDC
jgi:uncharacterized protein (TIGR00730 family)